MNKQRLWIISELFYPDETSTGYILTDMANKLVEKYDVHVICGPEIYDKKKSIDKNSQQTLDKSISLHRIDIINLDKDKLISRLLRFFVSSQRLYSIAKSHVKKEDKVLLVTNPPLLIKLIANLKKKVGFEFILLVHDVFPENALAAGLKMPHFVYKMTKHVLDKSYAMADKLIALGRDMKAVLEQKVKGKGKPEICIVENWGDVDKIHPIETNPNEKIIIGYAGNIGRGQGLLEFLEVYRQVNNNNLSLHFWGTGAVEDSLKDFVLKHKIKDVKFHGPFFRSQQNEVLNACDIALVKLAKNMFGIGVPSKAYNILAAGKPILYIGHPDSEISLEIKDNNIGLSFDNDDKTGLIEFLESLNRDNLQYLKEMGLNARKLAENKYSQKVILDKLLNTI